MAQPDQSLQALKLDSFDLLRTPTLFAELEASEAVKELDGAEVRHLAGLLKAYEVPAGTTIFSEGDAAAYMGMVLDGRLTVSKRNDEASGKPLYSMTAGKVFGEMAILDGEPRSASVTAAATSHIAVLSRDAFDTLCRERPMIALKILRRLGRLLSQRLRRTSGLLVDYLP
ncbi:cyclic nucleotide-binding domain-containing protein [Chitinimonas arctica]|uniref:Cyclic nucleotide-binding domain-containing protein n=1 Tax=Chitinimonas arctica TaxID=2594795 RepID=A0A516SL49_9NEIS|nr:cyclic nucleotide-binding domain-containing protein [Chitinimonas arctica]QDQ28875.1 cyclic nucleotide-binding domain-containing protein [Chitinimonas arctica]